MPPRMAPAASPAATPPNGKPPRQPPPKPAPPCQPPPPHRACAVFDDAIAVAAINAAAIAAVMIFLITSPRSRCTVQLQAIEPTSSVYAMIQINAALITRGSVVAPGQLVDLALHFVELPFQIVDLAAAALC